MSNIRRLGEQFAADRVFTPDEAKALVDAVQADGAGEASRGELRHVLELYHDLFQPAAAEVVRPVLEAVASPTSGVKPLDASGAYRAVFLDPQGTLSLRPDGAAPANAAELGEALFRAAELVDDARGNVFAGEAEATRARLFSFLQAALAQVAPGATPPAGLEAAQVAQLRGSAVTVLLHLLEASPEPELRAKLAQAYEAQVRSETDPRMRETMIFHLANSPAAQAGPVKALAGALMAELAPTTPPYDQWFANGNRTLNLSWTVGHGEFWSGFVKNLKANGFKPVGREDQYGVSVYERKVNYPGVEPTTFRISIREGGTDILAPMGDPSVHIVGYDGHSNWGRNMSSSLDRAPTAPEGGAGKLLFYNLCVGKGVLDRVREQYPNGQVVTTFAASMFYTDGNGKMTRGEGVQALLAMIEGIAVRAPWSTIHRTMNEAADIGDRHWDNYITPISTLTREKVLDRDNDGQADYLDKQFNYSTYQVPEDTAREFEPVKQPRSAEVLDGTKVLVAGNMINTISEFSGILELVNGDSKVIADGYFDPKLGERERVHFTRDVRPGGAVEFHMQVNARYAHMSEEALRATTVYEFNRYLFRNGFLRAEPVDAKLAGLIAFVQSMKVDEGYRDEEIWSKFLQSYGFPAEIGLGTVRSLLDEEHHHYSGSFPMVAKLKKELSRPVLDALARPEVGEPVERVG